MANKADNGQCVKIGSINIDGFSKKSQIVLDKYNQEQDFDVLLAQETNKNDKAKLKLTNMKVLIDTNSAKNRGAATFLKINTPYKELPEISKVTQEIDSVWCFAVIKNKRFIIGNVYAKLHYKNAIEDIMQMLKIAQTKAVQLKAPNIILAGDFNARHTLWNDKIEDTNGRKLVDQLDHTKFKIIHSKTPSFLCVEGSSNIDLIIASQNVAKKIKSCTTDELVHLYSGAPKRGHVPVITEIESSNKQKTTTATAKLDVSAVNWDQWKQELENQLKTDSSDILKHKNPMKLWDYFVEKIDDVTKKHGVMKKSCCHSKPFWTKQLTLLRDKMKNARKFYKKRNTESNLLKWEEAKEEFDQVRKAECQDFLLNKTKTLNAAQLKTFWKEFNRIFKTKADGGIEPLDNSNGGVLTENEDMEEKLFETFFECKHMQEGGFDEYFYNTINDLYEEILEDFQNQDMDVDPINFPISIKEIMQAIKKTNPNKVSFDNFEMHPKMLHNLGDRAIKLIQRLFNLSMNQGQWVWNQAQVIFLKKDGKDTYSIPGSYRPICITSYVGKVLEKIIAARIFKFLTTNGYHDPNQEGFTMYKNTVRYLNRLYLEIKIDLQDNKTVVGVFIDMEKAFDSVWKKGLIVKLSSLNIKGKVLKLINNFLTSRVVKLNVNGFKGEEKETAEYGLPQGSALSPILFKVYLMDILKNIQEKPGISLLKFADDGTVKVSSKSTSDCIASIEEVLTELHDWCKKWRMVINCNKDKTEYICFGVAQKHDEIPNSFKIGDKSVQKVEKTKVLGLTIDSKLSFTDHSQKIYHRLCEKWVKICEYCNIHWGFNQKVLTRLINTLFLSIIQYCGHIYLNTKNMGNIEKLWNKLIKSAVGSVFNIQINIGEVILGIPPLNIHTTSNKIKHYLKLNIYESPEDQLKKLINDSVNKNNSQLLEVKNSLKEVFKFLKWKLEIYPNQFSELDKEIVISNNISNYCELLPKACSYTKTMFKKYVEKIWHEKLKNQAIVNGELSVPKPSYQKLPIPDYTTREDEVLLMSLFYQQNLFNSFLYRHTYQTESPLCSRCKAKEETPFHIVCECNSDTEKICRIVEKIVGTDIEYADCNTLLNCSRNEEFILRCLGVLKQGNFRREITLTTEDRLIG